MDRIQIKEESKKALVGNRAMILVILIGISIVSGALASTGIGIVVGPLLSVGLFVILKDVLRGKKIDINRFGEIFKNLNHALKVFAVAFLTTLIVSIGFMLFIIPGIIFTLQYSQALYIIAENPEMGIWDAMKKSKEIMVDHKMDLFVFYLSFIGHYLLVIITFGLYALYIFPYFHICFVNYYLHLTNQKEEKIIELV